MNGKSRLRDVILNHWITHRPQMVKELLRRNQLIQSLRETEERTTDLLFELLSVQKMNYDEAWEIATREWGLLPTEDHPPPLSSTNSSQSPQKQPPATSE